MPTSEMWTTWHLGCLCVLKLHCLIYTDTDIGQHSVVPDYSPAPVCIATILFLDGVCISIEIAMVSVTSKSCHHSGEIPLGKGCKELYSSHRPQPHLPSPSPLTPHTHSSSSYPSHLQHCVLSLLDQLGAISRQGSPSLSGITTLSHHSNMHEL